MWITAGSLTQLKQTIYLQRFVHVLDFFGEISTVKYRYLCCRPQILLLTVVNYNEIFIIAANNNKIVVEKDVLTKIKQSVAPVDFY